LGTFLKKRFAAAAQSVSHVKETLQKNRSTSSHETSTATVSEAGMPAFWDGFSESVHVAMRFGGRLLTRRLQPASVIACDVVFVTVLSHLPVALRLAN
jgi:hypothetical protein